MAEAKAKPQEKIEKQRAANKKSYEKKMAVKRALRKKNPPPPKPAKANKNWAIDNANAQKWTDEGLQELADKIAEASKEACSIVGIAVEVGVAYKYLTALGDRYETVSRALDLASNRIAHKAWKQGFKQEGFPNILQMALKRHDAPQVAIEDKQETDKFDKKEAIKAKHGTNKETSEPIVVKIVNYSDEKAK